MTTTPSRMYQRRRSAAQWTAENPTLAAGEIGVETDGQMPVAKVGDGTKAWTSLVGPMLNWPYLFLQHDDAVTIPNNVWTPLPWNNRLTEKGGDWSGGFVAASTTIAAGSNGQALPQATINVASAASFATAGHILINIGGTDRVVQYTGKTATTFTGCTLGVGTMTTADAVRQAHITPGLPAGVLVIAIAEVAFASNPTGLRGIRWRSTTAPFFFAGGTTVVPSATAADPLIHIQTTEQPLGAFGSTMGSVEVYQSSGGNLDSVISALSAPRIVAVAVSAFQGI